MQNTSALTQKIKSKSKKDKKTLIHNNSMN
jgi:hypothetical protein